jgi:hypothetical protein
LAAARKDLLTGAPRVQIDKMQTRMGKELFAPPRAVRLEPPEQRILAKFSLRPDQSKTFKRGTLTYTFSRFASCKLFVNNNIVEYAADLKAKADIS